VADSTRCALLCPSADPHMEGAVVFGVAGGSSASPRVAYLDQPQPATPEVLALSAPVKPAEVFRVAARCAETQCQHFDGSRCRLATRIVQILPAVVSSLPLCRIRPECRWWQQEGREACLRCPQVVHEAFNPTEPLRAAAGPQPATAPEEQPLSSSP
jgi:hypothetical protein